MYKKLKLNITVFILDIIAAIITSMLWLFWFLFSANTIVLLSILIPCGIFYIVVLFFHIFALKKSHKKILYAPQIGNILGIIGIGCAILAELSFLTSIIFSSLSVPLLILASIFEIRRK